MDKIEDLTPAELIGFVIKFASASKQYSSAVNIALVYLDYDFEGAHYWKEQLQERQAELEEYIEIIWPSQD